MKLKGPIGDDDESLLESRIAHLETENVNDHAKGYFKESEFPDYQNSLYNANSTFFEQRKSTKAKQNSHTISKADSYSQLGKASMVSAGVGPSEGNMQS